MFHLIQNTGKGRRASRSGKAQRVSSTTWIGMVLAFLFIGSFVRFGPVLRPVRADEPTITIYKLTTASIETGCFADDALAIKINDKTINTNLTFNEYEIKIAPGPQTISVSVPGKPNVKVSKVVVGTSEEDKQTYPADASGVATVQLERKLGSINVIVYLTGLCGEGAKEFEAKRFHIVVKSWNCKDPNYKDLTIKIGNTEVTNFEVVRNDEGELIASGQSVELKPGSYQVQATGPGHSDTEVALVEVVDSLHEYGKFYPASKGRAVDVVLEERIWKSEAGPGLMISLDGNCADPDFYDLKVLAVTGKVEIIGPGINDKPKQAKVNDSIFRFQTLTKTIRSDSGGSIILESEHGHVITIAESTEVQANLIMTAGGREKLEAFVKMGKIQIKRVKPESHPIKVRTPSAGAVDFETIFMVSHDEKTNITTVGVEEGKVEVTPVNSSLKPVTLAANQQVQVSDKSVSAVTHYSGESTRATGMLFYVGIGVAALVGILVVVAGISFLYRKVNRAPVQPAFQQSGIKVEATPAKFAVPAVATNEWRCPNPQCGKLVPATKKFCTACGTRSGFKVETTPAYVASPAVASRERHCPNPQCGKLVAARKKFCTACGASVI